jgi:hypothetical protein
MGKLARKCRLCSKRRARIATVAQSALVDVVRGERDVSHGVTARELLELSGNRDAISAASLERWLLESGFVEPNGQPGRLVPTPLALEIAGDLRFLT